MVIFVGLTKADGNVSSCGRTVTNLQFTYGTDIVAKDEHQSQELLENRKRTCTKYEMEINIETNICIKKTSLHSVRRLEDTLHHF